MQILITRNPQSTMSFLHEDLGLGMIASSLRAAGYPCRIDDGLQSGVSPATYIDGVAGCDEEIVCITVHADSWADETLEYCRAIKRQAPHKTIIAGGHPVAVLHELILQQYPDAVDFLVRGEGERTAVELVDWLSNGRCAPDLENIAGLSYLDGDSVVATADRPRSVDMHSLPFAARDVWSNGLGRPLSNSANIFFSRGCNHLCKFCSVVSLRGVKQRRWLARPVEDLIEEIAYVQSNFDVFDFTFIDPNFLGDPQTGNAHVDDVVAGIQGAGLDIIWDVACRADSIEPALVERLYEAGLRRVFMGLESGNQSLLNDWRKALDVSDSIRAVEILADAGVYVNGGFIMMRPDSAFSELSENIAFLRRLPYFEPMQLGSSLWPLHETITMKTIDDDLIERTEGKIYPTFLYRDPRVGQFAHAASTLWQVFSGPFCRMRDTMWHTMREDPAVISRYQSTLQDLLGVYLEMAEKAIETISGGVGDFKLEGRLWKWISHNERYVHETTSSFS